MYMEECAGEREGKVQCTLNANHVILKYNVAVHAHNTLYIKWRELCQGY